MARRRPVGGRDGGFQLDGDARLPPTGLFPSPLSTGAALERLEAWTSASSAAVVEPTPRHHDLVAALLRRAGTGGNLVNDAHLAALAIEHRGVVVSYDNDFGRFPQVAWRMP